MRFSNLGKAAGFSVLIVMAVVLIATGVNAQQMTPIAGKITAKYAKIDSIVVSATDGHLMSLSQSEGTNVNAGKTPFLDGGVAINMTYTDVVKGNGMHQGYINLMKAGDSALAKWHGKITTVMNPEGVPATTFEGVFNYVSGTGAFAGIKGEGTYRGAFTSKTDYTVEWQGEYTLGK